MTTDRQQKNAGSRDVRKKHVGDAAFVQWLASGVTAYARNPRDSAALADLRQARSMLAEFFLDTKEEMLQRVFSNQLAKLFLALAGSGLRDLSLGKHEQSLHSRVVSAFQSDAKRPPAPGNVLAAMLYCRPDDPAAAFLDREVPDWLYGLLVAFLLMEPYFFDDASAFRSYLEFERRVMRQAHRIVSEANASAAGLTLKARATALSFANFSCPIYMYFGDGDLRAISENRAHILEQNARASGLGLNWDPPPVSAERAKLRLGILKPHFSSQTETFATLPVFEHLDRRQFEVILYAVGAARNDMERYCANHADRLVLLPRTPQEQAATIRNDRLDILFFGSNLTAGVDACTTLALHRLAPIQVASICCPVTTGFSNMDYYIAGDLLALSDEMQPQFREKLVNIPGSGLCFSYGPEPTAATRPLDRQGLGIPADAVVYISGANYFKITPEVREAWATIIARVPGSVLVLYPFNPNWSSWYNPEPFIADVHKHFARLGLGNHRLKILDPLANRADVKTLLGLADVYLDSFPYGGATSLIDTLQAGLPPVVIQGRVLRFRQAAAMLQEISLSELIADTVDTYIDLACRLGTDAGARLRLRQAIQEKMKNDPPFLDSRAYALKMARLFARLREERPAQGGDLSGD